jgi:16S rRNA (guanine527-N7)-methyltransferase
MLKQLQQQLPEAYKSKAPQFEAFLNLLCRWNKAYNLTAIRDVSAMIPLHLLDSIAIIPCLKGQRILDVGTGPGFPGIPLAICLPDLAFSLLETNGKRVRFLETVVHELGLKNVKIIKSRVEAYQDSQGFDTICSRAFSHLNTFIELSRHLLAKDGQWAAMKGLVPHEELATIDEPNEIYSYAIPGQNVARCCVIIKQKE